MTTTELLTLEVPALFSTFSGSVQLRPWYLEIRIMAFTMLYCTFQFCSQRGSIKLLILSKYIRQKESTHTLSLISFWWKCQSNQKKPPNSNFDTGQGGLLAAGMARAALATLYTMAWLVSAVQAVLAGFLQVLARLTSINVNILHITTTSWILRGFGPRVRVYSKWE